MSKMNEKILVVERDRLFANEATTFQGVLTNMFSVNHFMNKMSDYKEVRRGHAEENQAWKQPITYVVLQRLDEVFMYKRLKAGGETRLHDNLSIGVGGHMNRMDDSTNWDDILMFNMYKELGEELDIQSPVYPEPKILGLINDDSNDVGMVHLGILAVLNLPKEAKVMVRETDRLEGQWIRISDLEKTPLFESLEPWSKIAMEVL